MSASTVLSLRNNISTNCHSVLATEMPHGGARHSGFGSNLSIDSIKERTRFEHVVSRFEP